MEMQEKSPKKAFNSLISIGERHHSVPEQLYTDDRLTNRAKMLWQMLKVDSSPYKSQFFPSYEQMQIWLSEQAFLGKKVSRKIVTQTLQILRLTRWITLCETERDALGRIVGNVYVIHNTALTVLDTMQISNDYFEFVEKMAKSKDNFVKAVAESVIDELISENTYHTVSHLEMYRQAFERKQASTIQLTTPQEPLPQDLATVTNNVKHRVLNQPQNIISASQEMKPKLSSVKELSEKQLSSIKELSQEGQKLLSSIMELGENDVELNGTKQNKKANSLIYHLVPSGNSYSTNISTYSTCTVLDEFKLNKTEKGNMVELLNQLDDNLRSQVLDAARLSIKARNVQKPVGYLFAMVHRALQGNFKPYYILQGGQSQNSHAEISPKIPAYEPKTTETPNPMTTEERLAWIAKCRAVLH